jgi:hypothetical protein
MPLRVREIKALFRSLWRQGVVGNYRLAYWTFLLRVLTESPARFSEAIRLAVQGHHLILTTQEALQADELRTFCTEATERLERFCQDYREVFQINVSTYTSRLMQRVQGRFEQFRSRTITERFSIMPLSWSRRPRRTIMLHGKWLGIRPRELRENFFGEIARLLAAHLPDDGSIPPVR